MNAEPMTESLKAARPSGPGKVAVTFAVLVLLVSIVFFLSLSIGPAAIEFSALFGQLTGGDADTAILIMREMRLPRAIFAPDRSDFGH